MRDFVENVGDILEENGEDILATPRLDDEGVNKDTVSSFRSCVDDLEIALKEQSVVQTVIVLQGLLFLVLRAFFRLGLFRYLGAGFAEYCYGLYTKTTPDWEDMMQNLDVLCQQDKLQGDYFTVTPDGDRVVVSYYFEVTYKNKAHPDVACASLICNDSPTSTFRLSTRGLHKFVDLVVRDREYEIPQVDYDQVEDIKAISPARFAEVKKTHDQKPENN